MRTGFLVALALGVGCAASPPRPGQAPVSSKMQPTGSPFFESPPPPLNAIRRARVPVASSPVLGPSDAPVTLVVFTVFNNCGACVRASLMLEELQAEYGKDLRIVWKGVADSRDTESRQQLLAALAAGEQGQFWEMTHAMCADPKHLDAASLESKVAALGLDRDKWKAASASPQLEKQLQDDLELAVKLRLPHKPWFFVNGRSLAGPASRGSLEALIDEELAAHASVEAEAADVGSAVDPPAAPLSAEECPPAGPDAPQLPFNDTAMVAVCRDIYVDPTMTTARAARVARDWVEARKRVALALGPLSPAPLTLVCDSDACRSAFGGKEPASLTVGPGGRLPGPAGFTWAHSQILMLDAVVSPRSFFAHEMVHAEMFGRAPGKMPNWFSEGLATSIAGAPGCSRHMKVEVRPLGELTSNEAWKKFTEGADEREAAYCAARTELETWVRKHGRPRFFELVEQVERGTPFDVVYGPLLTK